MIILCKYHRQTDKHIKRIVRNLTIIILRVSDILKDTNLIFNKFSVETDRQPEKYKIFKNCFIKNLFC
jgi:hypothetical protein